MSCRVERNDGSTAYRLKVPADVPVEAFGSVSVYNADGYFEKNGFDLYSLNNLTAKKSEDGSVILHFGGGPRADNYLPIVPGWNYTVSGTSPRPKCCRYEQRRNRSCRDARWI